MAAPELSLDDQKKMVVPFLQRAQEIERADPKMAYYCRLYAVDQAVSIPRRAKEINGLVTAAITKLEKDKAGITLDKEQDRYSCEAFAMKVFSNADRVDRAGKAESGTAKAFLAASYFFEILNQFGPLDSDLASKQRYAVWRAAEISKAIREGRAPTPPPGTNATTGGPENSGPSTAQDDFSFMSASSKPWVETSGGSASSTGGGPPPPSMPPPPTLTPPNLPPPPSWSGQPGPAAPLPPPAPAGTAAGGGSGGGGVAVLPGQRYKPGSTVLFCETAGIGGKAKEEPGTVGQVFKDDEGNFRYRIALRERLVQATDMQVAPNPAEGALVTWTQRETSAPVTARVVLVNDGFGWPPTYLVALPDGQEMSAQAHQISMILPEDLRPADRPRQQQPQVLPPGPPQGPGTSGPPPPPGPAPGAPPGGWPGGMSAADWVQHNRQSSGSAHSSDGGSGGAWKPAAGQGPPPPPAGVPGTARPPGMGGRPGEGGLPGYGAQPAAPAPPAAATRPWTSQGPPAPPPPQQPGWITIPALQPGHKPSITAISEAQKAARTAVSSLNFEDAAAAVKYLTHAIQVLTDPASSRH